MRVRWFFAWWGIVFFFINGAAFLMFHELLSLTAAIICGASGIMQYRGYLREKKRREA